MFISWPLVSFILSQPGVVYRGQLLEKVTRKTWASFSHASLPRQSSESSTKRPELGTSWIGHLVLKKFCWVYHLRIASRSHLYILKGSIKDRPFLVCKGQHNFLGLVSLDYISFICLFAGFFLCDHSIWDLSCPASDGTHTPCSGSLSHWTTTDVPWQYAF